MTATGTEPPADALPEGPWAAHTELDVLGVSGPDAVAYLQGQLSQDVAAMAVGAWTQALLLEPQGKMCAWLRVHRAAGDRVELVVDAGFGQAVEQRLRRFWLRTKAELTLRESVPTLAVRDRPADPPTPSPEVDSDGLVAPVGWPGHGGIDLIGAVPPPEGVQILEGDAGQQALTLARVAAGVPAMGAEIGPDTIPAAAGIVDPSVSFTKGCYTGQELVARIDSRGNKTPSRLVRLAGTGPAPAPGTPLSVEGTERASVTTAVASAAAPSEAWLGLGYLHRSVDTPAQLSLPGGAAVTAEATSALE